MKQEHGFLNQIFWSLISLGLMAMLALGIFLIYIQKQLPDVTTLKNVQLQVPMRVYTRDGKLIAEFGEMRRIPVSLEDIPKPLIQALLATEDQRFYEHVGVDFYGLLRAAKHLIATGTKGQGGSTITMQVARNFFLTRQKTYIRKVRELLLAIKIDQQLTKDKILELYFNKIFFGNRAYGIAAAAQVYYGKTLAELTLPEMAMLAGIPKAPSSLNPLVNPQAAIERRNHVLARMLEMKYINDTTYQEAVHTPLMAQYHALKIDFHAPYVAEMARNFLVEHFGESIYTQGVSVYTTVDSKQQLAAEQAVQKGLLEYEMRHGYRGPEQHLTMPDDEDPNYWMLALDKLQPVNGLLPAVVTGVAEQAIEVLLSDARTITIPWSGLSWARKQQEGLGWSPAPKSAAEIVKRGDVIRVRQDGKGQWYLTQLPQIEGALVSMQPTDGAILALIGGFAYSESHFNRVWQAKRQPGSNFKPFVYAAALAQDYTLASVVNDAPVVLNDTGDDTLWRPQNDTRKFYGPTRLRVGLTRSRNLVSIRLLQDIGVAYAREYLANFGFQAQDLPDNLSLALGTASVTPLDLVTGYATFANGGFLIHPYLIDYVTDNDGNVVYQVQPKQAYEQETAAENQQAGNTELTTPVDIAPRTISKEVSYLMTTVLRDAVQHGTGKAAKVLGREDVAGKTGTTNDQYDAWFTGYTKDVVTTVWVGFDQPRTLREYGAQAALPIWIDFMRVALHGKSEQPLLSPSSIVTVRIDPETGLLAWPGQKDAIFEVFRSDLVPTQHAPKHNAHSDDGKDEAEPLF